MNNVFLITIKHVYGKPLVYPVSDNAKLFAKLLNAKTFTKQNLDTIKQIGFEIQQENEFISIDDMFNDGVKMGM